MQEKTGLKCLLMAVCLLALIGIGTTPATAQSTSCTWMTNTLANGTYLKSSSDTVLLNFTSNQTVNGTYISFINSSSAAWGEFQWNVTATGGNATLFNITIVRTGNWSTEWEMFGIKAIVSNTTPNNNPEANCSIRWFSYDATAPSAGTTTLGTATASMYDPTNTYSFAITPTDSVSGMNNVTFYFRKQGDAEYVAEEVTGSDGTYTATVFEVDDSIGGMGGITYEYYWRTGDKAGNTGETTVAEYTTLAPGSGVVSTGGGAVATADDEAPGFTIIGEGREIPKPSRKTVVYGLFVVLWLAFFAMGGKAKQAGDGISSGQISTSGKGKAGLMLLLALVWSVITLFYWLKTRGG